MMTNDVEYPAECPGSSGPTGVPEKTHLELGFIPLTDCAPLVVALEYGFFARHGLDVALRRQASWANIRDKVAAGMLDGAHMLAAMPLATSLGLGEVAEATVTALSLDLNGNAITVSRELYQRMEGTDPEAMERRPITARALKRLIDADQRAGKPALTFAMVFPFSTHNYVLRYWLAAAGIDPDRDIRLIVIPPPAMVDHLRSGTIDGFCVGEPWNAAAVVEDLGRVVITDYEIWNNKPEKVFGVNAAWAERYPKAHRAVVMALLEAAHWLDQPDNRAEAARLLARRAYIDIPADVIAMSMTGCYQYAAAEPAEALPDFHVFERYAATFPWRSHAVWLMTQMIRWGQIGEPVDIRRTASAVYRTDLYREAAEALGIPCPLVDYKQEGVHSGPWLLSDATSPITMGSDQFFDGGRFDPVEPLEYIESFALHHRRVALDDFRSRKA